MLSDVSLLLLSATLLFAMGFAGASKEELDCSLEARMIITSKFIDSALREMTNDIREHLSRNHECETKPINCQRDCIGYFGSSSDVKPLDCSDVYSYGNHTNGKYIIWPQSQITKEPLLVYCDMETDGGGWTVIQRRGDFGNPSDFFYRDWNEYKTGFGDLEKEFWIGNDNLFALTNQRSYQIRFDLWDWDDTFKYSIYNEFRVGNESQAYTLHVKGYNGTAGDSFSYHSGMKFSTKNIDNDNDNSVNCAVAYSGAWWYKDCLYSNLNGFYSKERGKADPRQVSWRTFLADRYFVLKQTNMKIRPLLP